MLNFYHKAEQNIKEFVHVDEVGKLMDNPLVRFHHEEVANKIRVMTETRLYYPMELLHRDIHQRATPNHAYRPTVKQRKTSIPARDFLIFFESQDVSPTQSGTSGYKKRPTKLAPEMQRS